jgi:hypothetical protein
MNAPAPGWNPDPTGRHEYRYWDGSIWTDDVSDSGVTSVDAIAGAEAGAPGAEPTAAFEPTQAYGAPTGPPPGPDPYGGGPPGPGGPGGYDPYGSGQMPPAQPPKSGPPVGLIVGIAVVALVVIVGLVVALSGGDDDETSTDDTTTTEETSDDTTDDTTDDTSTDTEPENSDVFDLGVGDCVASETAGDVVEEVPIVSCEEPHLSEVYFSHIIEADELPDEAGMQTLVEDVCLTEFQNFVGLDYYESALEVTWLEPTPESWEAGDHELLCLVQDPSGNVTGTLEGANY